MRNTAELPHLKDSVMLDVHKIVVDSVDAFLARTGMAPSRLGLEVCRDGHLVPSLRAGSITLGRVQATMRYIADHPATQQPAAR